MKIEPGDIVLIVTYGGTVLYGNVVAVDDRKITLKLRGRATVKIDLDIVKEIKVFKRVKWVK